MKLGLLCVLVCCFGVCAAAIETQLTSKIKHVIVLMLENRSLDHMLGFLKTLNPDVNGCVDGSGGCSNPLDPLDPMSPRYSVDDSAVYVQASPSHSIYGTTQQIYPDGVNASMNGFVASYTRATGSNTIGPTVMKCFNPSHVPVIANLSMEYGFFDGWFASVPGPTMVNRAFAASGSSHGMGTNDAETIARGLPQKTMFKQLLDMGLDYRVYFQDVPSVLMFKDMRRKAARGRYHVMSKLFDDLAAGDMPEFSWLEPSYFDSPLRPASDQHPDHDVSIGEQLIKDVYEAVRASSIWNETAFIVTYDEHGGFFDHVVPPEQVPSPDGINSVDDPFDFTRLGVRIPTVIVSPWVKKGSVFHAPPAGEGQYDHTSVISTVVHKLFKPKDLRSKPEFLTKRDAWAASFEWVFDEMKTAREDKDCPTAVPVPPSHRLLFPNTLPLLTGQGKVTDLQVELVAIVEGVTAPDDSKAPVLSDCRGWTEYEAAAYCTRKLSKFFSEQSN